MVPSSVGQSAEPGLVSTIVPVYNRPTLLREAVASVLAQTYRPIEIVIVDDGSTDDTARVCAELAEKHPEVSALRIANGGPGLAREAGRQRARGEFIQYLDSDDLLRPRKFEIQVAALGAEPECGVAYGPTWELELEGAAVGWPSPHSESGLATLFPELLSYRPWHTLAPLYRRSVIEAVGSWTDLRQEEDLEYDARVAALGVKLAFVPELVADVRHPSSGRASGGSLQDQSRMRSRQRSHGLVYRHARRAGIGPESPHMQRYARELFLLARQCGAVGLPDGSRELFELAREASGPTRARALDFRLYRLAAAALGWSAVGRVACWSDGWRDR